MATITGLTAERMLGIEGASVVDGEIISGKLILIKHDGTTVDAGTVVGPAGPAGPAGPSGGNIPGEIKMWSGGTLPAIGTYGRWVWADGTARANSAHPIAASHISTAWRTAFGQSDPGGTNFRVPDLRGLTPAGLDQMPGGSRANRLTRSIAITLAGKTGEETHVLTIPEMPTHTHAPTVSGAQIRSPGAAGGSPTGYDGSTVENLVLQSTGGNGAHENLQPTVFVPYIVYLDG